MKKNKFRAGSGMSVLILLFTIIGLERAFSQGNPQTQKSGNTGLFSGEMRWFIRRNKEKPFCLYVAYHAVHYPWDAPDKYTPLVKFIENWNRRLFAGMVLALDDGVGLILERG